MLDPKLRQKYLRDAPRFRSSAEHAAHEGMNRNTFDSRLSSFGIRAECSASYRKKREEEVRASVVTPEGRERANAQVEMRALRAENRRLTQKLLDQENFFDRIVAASTEPLPRPNLKVRRGARKRPERFVLLPIFDCQYGQRVVPDDTVGGIGGFDSSVFAERLATYVEKVSALMESYSAGHDIKGLVFALGGDMVEGDEIFKGQEWHLEMDPAEQVLQIRDHLAYAIDALMGAAASLGVSQASVLCVPGNHGRVGGKKGGARPRSYSWDVLVYKLLKERLANHPLKNFVIEKAGNCTFEVAGNLFGMIHGDEVKGWGGIPFYGLTRHDAKMIRTLNVIPDYVLLGHHHQPAAIPIGYGEHLMSGNWVGANNLSGVVGSNTPSQSAFFVSREHGVCDRSMLYLDEKRKPTPTIHQTA